MGTGWGTLEEHVGLFGTSWGTFWTLLGSFVSFEALGETLGVPRETTGRLLGDLWGTF